MKKANKFVVMLDGSEEAEFDTYAEAMICAHKFWLEGRHVFVSSKNNREKEVWSDQPVSDEVIDRCMKKTPKRMRKNS
jgi:hypothetical protein